MYYDDDSTSHGTAKVRYQQSVTNGGNNNNLVSPASSDYSSQEGEDTYKEKIEQFKLILEQQQKELASSKIRAKGMDTLTSCLQEERDINDKLRTSITKHQQAVTVLQTRLERFGASTNTSLQDGEILLPCGNKQLQENLIHENQQMQQCLKVLRADPNKMEQLAMDLSESKRENAKLSEEMSQARALLNSSSDKKDMEISRLQQRLEQTEQTRETQEEMCQSLSSESVNLRQKLKELAEICQTLAKKLDEKEKRASETKATQEEMKKLTLTGTSAGHAVGEECAALRVRNSSLQTEVEKLKVQINELLDSNKKWQSYDQQREEYIQRLLNKQTEQEQSLNARARVHTQPLLTEDQQQEIDRLLNAWKQKVGQTEEEKMKIEDENRALRVRCQQQENAMILLQEQVVSLQEQVTSPQATSSLQVQASNDNERISALELQIQLCTEDFQQERRDRERAQQKLLDVEQELDIVKRQLEQFQVQHMQDLHQQRLAALTNYRNQYEQRNQFEQQQAQLYGRPGYGHQQFGGYPQQQNRLIARGVESVVADCAENEDEDVIDSLPRGITMASLARYGGPASGYAPPVETQTVGNDDVGSRTNADMLECPKCHKQFPSERHEEFLEHIDECCN